MFYNYGLHIMLIHNDKLHFGHFGAAANIHGFERFWFTRGVRWTINMFLIHCNVPLSTKRVAVYPYWIIITINEKQSDTVAKTLQPYVHAAPEEPCPRLRPLGFATSTQKHPQINPYGLARYAVQNRDERGPGPHYGLTPVSYTHLTLPTILRV